MPVKIPDGLPAIKVLEGENVRVIPERQAFAQDIRPLQIAIVNLMPLKSVAETQLLRLLSNSPLQVSVTFLRLASYQSKNTTPRYLAKFYRDFGEVLKTRFDCLIITGAPVETLPFSAVAYWDELRRVMDWSLGHVYSTLHICWGAQAGLYHHYGVPKHDLSQKMFGIFEHTTLEPRNPILQGFDTVFLAPHSRHTEIRREDVLKNDSLQILSDSEKAGVYIVGNKSGRHIFVTGHPEYDQLTLKEEYDRDRSKGLSISLPINYFPGDDSSRPPVVSWRAHASLLFTNWLNNVYQHTLFDLNELGPP
jgi:homoserine O-succinyltransferase